LVSNLTTILASVAVVNRTTDAAQLLECWRGCPPASSLPKEPRITNADLTDQERKTVLEGPPKPF
jgi:hypothetical protein